MKIKLQAYHGISDPATIAFRFALYPSRKGAAIPLTMTKDWKTAKIPAAARRAQNMVNTRAKYAQKGRSTACPNVQGADPKAPATIDPIKKAPSEDAGLGFLLSRIKQGY